MQANPNPNPQIWYKQWWVLLIFGLGTFFLIMGLAFGIYVYEIRQRIKSGEINTQKIVLNETVYEVETADSYWLGSSNPKLTIVYFADFACPYCEKSYTKIREISQKYKDKVKIVYRDYPLHNESIDLAMAGRCAGEQGLFWLMHDKLFQNQGVTTKEELKSLATRIGADETRYEKCFSDRKYLTQIQKDLIDGQKIGLKGTPTWFFNGHKVEGDIPFDYLTKLVEQIIR